MAWSRGCFALSLMTLPTESFPLEPGDILADAPDKKAETCRLRALALTGGVG